MIAQAQQQQSNQPDPAMVQAQGVLMQGQAELQKAQNEQAAIQVKAFQAQTDAQVAAANVVKILATADSQQKSDIREALKLLSQFQQQSGDNARADAELVLKGQAQGHSQRLTLLTSFRTHRNNSHNLSKSNQPIKRWSSLRGR